MFVDTFEDGLNFCMSIVEVSVLLEHDAASHRRRTETMHYHATLVQETLSSLKFSSICRYNFVFCNDITGMHRITTFQSTTDCIYDGGPIRL